MLEWNVAYLLVPLLVPRLKLECVFGLQFLRAVPKYLCDIACTIGIPDKIRATSWKGLLVVVHKAPRPFRNRRLLTILATSTDFGSVVARARKPFAKLLEEIGETLR